MKTTGCLLTLSLIAVLAVSAHAASSGLIKRVTIYDTQYAVVDVRDLLGKIPQPMVQTVVALSRYCKSAKAYGFYAGREVGIVAFAPRSFIDCIDGNDNDGEVVGGGPSEVCGFYYKTSRYYVAVAANKSRVCARLTTQAPGGYAASANQAFNLPGTSVAAGQYLLITCQRYEGGILKDYILLQGGLPIPGNRTPYWVADEVVDTGGQTRLPGVPLC